MSETPFAKVEGIGNDFIVLEGEAALHFDAEAAPGLCDRHFGIGADGVLLILPAEDHDDGGERDEHDSIATMRVINADGSEPEMCGNGLRCVALMLARSRAREGQAIDGFVVDTGAGPKLCTVHGDPSSGQALVAIDMGTVSYLEEISLEHGDRTLTFHRVDAGNPHAITFDTIDEAEWEAVGRDVEQRFPGRTNVEFASVDAESDPPSLTLTVWERGVGFTLACGTGACATAVAAWHTRRLEEGAAAVHLPGGQLVIEAAGEEEVRMIGPARLVFTGDF